MGAGRRRPAHAADRGRHRRRSRFLTWIAAFFAARPVSIVDVAFGVALAVSAYGAVAAIAYTLTTPPFAEVFGLPRWTVFSFFTASGMALTSTLLQAPLFLALILLMRRRRAAGPALLLLVGGIAGVLAGLIFTYSDGIFAAERLGDYRQIVKTTLPVGIVLAFFVWLAALLRRRLATHRRLERP